MVTAVNKVYIYRKKTTQTSNILQRNKTKQKREKKRRKEGQKKGAEQDSSLAPSRCHFI